MNARAHRWLLPVAAVLLLGVAPQEAGADVSKKVCKAFKGQLIVSSNAVETGGSDKEVIAAFKAAKVKAVKGEANSEDVAGWSFHYTAFLKKLGFTSLVLEFYSGSSYVADQRLEGVDPKDPVVEGDISITEDDGPAKGKTYTLKMVGKKGGKETVLATTTLVMD